MTAITTQATPAGVFDVTVRLTDEDAKRIMVATPNVSITWNNKNIFLFEMNPVHLVPGQYRMNLQQGVPTTIPNGTALTVNF